MMIDIGTKEHLQALEIFSRHAVFPYFRRWVEASVAEIHRVARFSQGDETQKLIGEAAVLRDLLDCINHAPKRLEAVASGAPSKGIHIGADT